MRYSRRSKYNAKRVRIDNYLFDSHAEARRYNDLKLMLKAGSISYLVVHPKYPIVYGKNKICIVELDFEYTDGNGEPVFEDIKGVYTPMSRLKHKLFTAFYGDSVRVVKVK